MTWGRCKLMIKLGETLMAIIWLSTPTLADPDHDRGHDEVKRLRDEGEILPLETIIGRYSQGHSGGRLLEAELEHEHGRYVYSLEVLHEDGKVVELEYDAHTGELLEIEEEH